MFGAPLLCCADVQGVALQDGIRKEVYDGFSQGDDAFDALVGLFGMLQVCLGQREPGERGSRPRHPILTGSPGSAHN